MSKKINSVELEKIIAEELEKALVDEGFFSRVGASLKAAAPEVSKGAGGVVGSAKKAIGNIVGAFKGGYGAKKQEEENSEKLVKIVGLIGDYIQANRTVPQVMKAIKNTEIVKKLGLMEALPSSYEAELQAKGVNQDDVNEFLQAVKDIQSAKDFFKELLSQSVAQQPASAQSAATEPEAAGQPSPTDQTQPAAGQPAAAGSNDQQSIIQRMGDIVAQGRSEQQPVSVRTTPAINTLIRMQKNRDGSEYVGGNVVRQYKFLRDAKNLNITDSEIQKLLPVLIRNRLLYIMASVRESQEQIKIWQDKGINTEEKLRNNTFFTSLVNYLSKETKVGKNKIIPFLIAIWQQGKLAMPTNKLDGPTNTKADIERIYSQPDYDEFYSGLNESRRWKELAGILKD